jgi:hypothetical protein
VVAVERLRELDAVLDGGGEHLRGGSLQEREGRLRDEPIQRVAHESERSVVAVFGE